MDTPTMSMPAPVEQRQNPSFFAKYKFSIISLCVILIALIPLLIISKNAKKSAAPQTQVAQNTVPPTPTSAPITTQNADPTLSATSQHIQDAVNQSNQDLNQVSQIDTSQDSVAGL